MRSIILLSIFSFIAFPVWACSCMAPTEKQAYKAYKDTDIIIKGKILAKSGGWESSGPLIKIDVSDIYKGTNIPDVIMVNYNSNTAACGNHFEIDKDYIIALYDTRSLTLNDENTRGYGFRVMSSCHQYQIQHYFNLQNGNKRTDESIPDGTNFPTFYQQNPGHPTTFSVENHP